MSESVEDDDELRAAGLSSLPRDRAPLDAELLDVVDRQAHDRLRAWVTGDPPKPALVGRFVLLRRVGTGGMGTVYSAYDEQLDRKLALKLVHPDRSEDPEAERRLLREAQALARLSHPNLVPVYEVGRHEGQVYLAMELVRGQTMRAWVQHEDPGWRRVLRAWIDVGRALAMVHAVGLVHRDVKPDNVLMGDDGRVRLVDFGLARRMEGASSTRHTSDTAPGSPAPPEEAPADDRITHSHALVGTPAYVAPEQRQGAPIEPAADQFAFCVSLYEGLYRARPPPDPKGELAPEPEPGGHGVVPASVQRALRKGMALDPQARFPSMHALLEALELPLRQRRRGRWLIGGTAAIALTITAIATNGGWMHSPTVEQAPPPPCAGVETELEAIWNDRARANVSSGARIMVDAFALEWGRVRREVCEATRVSAVQSETIMDRRITCLDRQRDHLAAQLFGTRDSDALVELSELSAPSDCLLSGVGENAVEPLPAEHREAAEALRRQLVQAARLATDGELEQARHLARTAVERAERIGYEPLLAMALDTLGQVEKIDFRSEPAHHALERAVDLAEAHGDLLLKEEILGHLVRVAIDVDADLVTARRAVERNAATLRRLGASRFREARLMMRRGLLLRLEEDLPGAEQALRNAEQQLEAEGPRAGPARASTLRNLANVLVELGRPEEARATLEHANRVDPAGSAPDDGVWHRTSRGDALLAEGQALLVDGELPAARERLQRALTEYRRSHGPDHPSCAKVHATLAQIAINEGRLDDARREAEAGDRAVRNSMGLGHASRTVPLSALGTVAFEQGRYEDAVEAFELALALQERIGASNGLRVASYQSNLAEALLRVGQTTRARMLAERALTTMSAHLPADHLDLAFPLRALAEAYVREGKADLALQPLKRALALHQAQPTYPVEQARTLIWLAMAHRDQGSLERARTLAEQAREQLAPLGQAQQDELALVHDLLANP